MPVLSGRTACRDIHLSLTTFFEVEFLTSEQCTMYDGLFANNVQIMITDAEDSRKDKDLGEAFPIVELATIF